MPPTCPRPTISASTWQLLTTSPSALWSATIPPTCSPPLIVPPKAQALMFALVEVFPTIPPTSVPGRLISALRSEEPSTRENRLIDPAIPPKMSAVPLTFGYVIWILRRVVVESFPAGLPITASATIPTSEAPFKSTDGRSIQRSLICASEYIVLNNPPFGSSRLLNMCSFPRSTPVKLAVRPAKGIPMKSTSLTTE